MDPIRTMRDMMARAANCISIVLGFVGIAHAQSYPSNSIRLIVPYNPGGVTDAVARIIAQKLSASWSVAVPVENRAGASGMIGANIVAKARPDGYALAFVASGHVLHPSLFREVPFDPLNDFTPVVLVVRSANVICVHPSVPVKSIKELVELARVRPGALSFGSAGIGNLSHLAGEMFKMAGKIDIVHIPYKGAGPAMSDLLGGQIPMAVSSLLGAMPFVKAGKIHALAVTSTKRQAVFPDVPTMVASGFPDFEAVEWWAVVGPAGFPKDILAKLNAEINRIVKRPDVQENLTMLGIEDIGGTPEQASAFMKSEMEKWTRVVKAVGLKPE